MDPWLPLIVLLISDLSNCAAQSKDDMLAFPVCSRHRCSHTLNLATAAGCCQLHVRFSAQLSRDPAAVVALTVGPHSLSCPGCQLSGLTKVSWTASQRAQAHHVCLLAALAALQVCIFGLTTRYGLPGSSQMGPVKILEPYSVGQQVVKDMQKEGCHAIVLLSHLG